MVRPPDDFIPLKNRPAHPAPFMWLFAMTNPDDGPILDQEGRERVVRATANPVAIQFGVDPITGQALNWYPWDVAFGEIPQTSDGTVDGVRLAISNAGGVFTSLYERNAKLQSHTVRMILVHADTLDIPDAKWEIKARVVESALTWDAAVLTLAEHDFQGTKVPSSLITRQCRWSYRSVQCGFSGDPSNTLGQCAKTLPACRQRGQWEIDAGEASSFLDALHPRRFGGFPALPAGAFRVA